MCSGTVVKLACGHECSVQHEAITNVNDRCSGCCAPAHVWEINQRYDLLREQNMAKIRNAISQQRFEDVDRLKRESKDNEARRAKELKQWKTKATHPNTDAA